MSIKVYLMLY